MKLGAAKLKKLEVVFEQLSDEVGATGYPVSPAVRALPEWYKKLARHYDFQVGVDRFDTIHPQLTVKTCPPFLDSMMTGYIIYTEQDLLVDSDGEGQPVFYWKHGVDKIGAHEVKQIAPEQIPEGYSSKALKFQSPYRVITPRGYSLLFVHPLNRHELPFITLSGVVETDSYGVPVNFPFLVKENWRGVIPAGTPIVQVIPIKRESWTHKFTLVDPKELARSFAILNSKIQGVYKKLFWVRKDYK
tara:strand:- start:78 stop:812 length:735 start_codon:yes stop_codon:yes gene_type:complete